MHSAGAPFHLNRSHVHTNAIAPQLLMDSCQKMKEAHTAYSESSGSENEAPYAQAVGEKERAQGKVSRQQKGKELHRKDTRT